MIKQDFKNKFSRHIGRILAKLNTIDLDGYSAVDASDILEDAKDYTKGELWLLCEDLIVMLDIQEQTNNGNEKTNN